MRHLVCRQSRMAVERVATVEVVRRRGMGRHRIGRADGAQSGDLRRTARSAAALARAVLRDAAYRGRNRRRLLAGARVARATDDMRIEVISSCAGSEPMTFATAGMTLHLLPVGKRDLRFWQPDELLRWMIGAVRRARDVAGRAAVRSLPLLVGASLRGGRLVATRPAALPGFPARLGRPGLQSPAAAAGPVAAATSGPAGLAWRCRRVRGQRQPARHGPGDRARGQYRPSAQRG